jgi:GNAT superfamily N-acetyltransferase
LLGKICFLKPIETMLQIRKTKLDDLKTILALLADDNLQTLEAAIATPLHLAAFGRIDGDSNQFLAVAEFEGQTVGCLQLSFITGLSRNGLERFQIEGLRIAHHLRGKDFGKQVLSWAVGHCRERGCGLVQLLMDKNRLDAHRFYESLGFKVNHRGFRLYFEE